MPIKVIKENKDFIMIRISYLNISKSMTSLQTSADGGQETVADRAINNNIVAWHQKCDTGAIR